VRGSFVVHQGLSRVNRGNRFRLPITYS
jgi:hypothetical protein